MASVKKELPINYETVTLDDIKDVRDPKYLSNYDLIILTESLEENPTYLPALFRGYLSDYMKNGGKLILYGVAGSRDPAEPSSDGWKQHNMDAYVPVSCTSNQGLCDAQESKDSVDVTSVNLKSKDIEHPILREFGTTIDVQDVTNSQFIDFTIVKADNKGKVLALLEIDADGKIRSYPAIVEQTGFTGPKTIYFAYHPSNTPTLFKNTLQYMFNL